MHSMHGYQITFFTQQDRRHDGKPLGEWLILLARELNLPGATLISGSEGIGHQRHIHATHFFDLADQPLEVQMVISEQESRRLFERLKKEGVSVFYVKTPVEFGTLGQAES